MAINERGLLRGMSSYHQIKKKTNPGLGKEVFYLKRLLHKWERDYCNRAKRVCKHQVPQRSGTKVVSFLKFSC